MKEGADNAKSETMGTAHETKLGGVFYSAQYGYNKDTILTLITYPTGGSITYGIDGVGRVSQAESRGRT